MCLCVHTDTCVCVYTDTCVCVYTQTYVSVCTHRRMCLCVHTDTCVCVYTQQLGAFTGITVQIGNYLIASRIPPGHFERAGGRSVNFQFGKMQFTCFRRATFEITVYSFSRRDFLYCNLLVFVALLSKLHFTSSRGADFEIAVHSFSLRQFRNWILLVFGAPIELFPRR